MENAGSSNQALDSCSDVDMVFRFVSVPRSGQFELTSRTQETRVPGRSHCKNMQKTRSKRYRAAAEKVDRKRKYPLLEAIKTLKSFTPTKFDQTVTLVLQAGS